MLASEGCDLGDEFWSTGMARGARVGVVADPDGDVAQIYKRVARTVAVKIAQQSKDFSSKFPSISVSKDT